MIRFLLFAVVAVALVALALMFSQNPDWTAQFKAFGYQMTLPFGLMVFLGLLVLWAFGWIYFLFRRALAMPAEVARNARISRQNRGYKALTQGLVALSAGDPDEAEKQARRATKLLDETPATLLLVAQSAQLNGDEDAAARYFETMTEQPETAFLGLRGLVMQAVARGDRKAVDALLDRARKIRPNAPWILELDYDLSLQNGRIDNAHRAVKRLSNRHLLPAAEAAKRLALAETDMAFRAATDDNWRKAVDHCRRALSEEADFLPALGLAARAYLELGHHRKARELAGQAWAQRPTSRVATTFLQAATPENATAKRAAITDLTAHNETALFSLYLLAEAAIEAGDREAAAVAIDTLSQSGAPVGFSALALRLDALRARGVDPTPTPLTGHSLPVEPLVCLNCGTEHDHWRAVCQHCSASGMIALPTRPPESPPKMLPPAL
ncbi:MAG: hypothetical protein CMF26_06650 [Kiloniella sp.]|nr:hypothetical protein [Kiloniella sp.]